MESRNIILWFHALAAELRKAGAPVEITSGLACVHYNLADNTKDCDLWIPPTRLDAFKAVVTRTDWQNSPVIYRSRLSAPLDQRWLAGGWSSHLTWSGQPAAHLDVFGILPRVLNHADSGTFSSEETLARVKMTQRDRDWPTVHLLGDRLATQNNPHSLLFLQEPESLFEARTRFSEDAWQTMATQRPLLHAVNPAMPLHQLGALVRIETTFWKIVDKLRLGCFRQAMEPYARASGDLLKTHATFADQDKALVVLAEQLLPPNPLAGREATIVDTAMEHALVLVDPNLFDQACLPRDWALASLSNSLKK